MFRRSLSAVLLAATSLCLSPLAAQAQEWPAKTVRILVGANPGGGSDNLARLIAERLGKKTGQTFVVENRPGVSNTLAAEATARANADGYTLLVAASTSQTIAPHLIDLNYDPLEDIQPVALITQVPTVLVTNKDMGWNSVADLVAYMKAHPGKVSYGSSGYGSPHVILAEQFNLSAGVKALHVPYKGASQTQMDIIGGIIHMTFDTTPAAMGQIKAGMLKPLAVTSEQRLAELPDVPTMKEAGYPDVQIQVVYGLYTTGGVPAAVSQRINAVFNEVLADPEFAQRLAVMGGSAQPLDVAQFEAMSQQELDKFGRIIELAGIPSQKTRR